MAKTMDKLVTNRIRYTLDEVQRNAFYQVPKFLFDDEFKKLSNDARMLYSLLRDRHELSVKNNWVNEHGEVYMIFSRENMCAMLNLSDKTITKAMTELKKYNLIDEQRRGQGKPNLIYLLTVDFTENRNIYDSRNVNFTTLDSENFRPSHTNINDTYLSQSQSQSQTMSNDIEIQPVFESVGKIEEKNKSTSSPSNNICRTSPSNEYKKYIEIIKDNIDYGYFNEDKLEVVDEILLCIAEVIAVDSDYVKIGQNDLPKEMVVSAYMKLTMEHIDHIMDQIKTVKKTIVHKHAYLKTCLFRVLQENTTEIENTISKLIVR